MRFITILSVISNCVLIAIILLETLGADIIKNRTVKWIIWFTIPIVLITCSIVCASATKNVSISEDKELID